MRSQMTFQTKTHQLTKTSMQRKKTLMQQIIMCLIVPIYSQQLFPNFVEDRYGNLSLFTTSYFKPHESICATYLWTEDNNCTKMESEAYDLEGNNMWFKQGKFPIKLTW